MKGRPRCQGRPVSSVTPACSRLPSQWQPFNFRACLEDVSLRAMAGMGRRKRAFDEDEVLRMLRAAIERAGGQRAFAKRHGLDRSNLNLVLSGKRPVTDSIAKPLGLRRLYVAAKDETLRTLRAATEREGGQSAFARRHGLSRSHLNRVLSGKRPVADAVARPLGLRGLYIAD
jgi:DNA-binding transcriptional regulator YdaS (Cro superfamily)